MKLQKAFGSIAQFWMQFLLILATEHHNLKCQFLLGLLTGEPCINLFPYLVNKKYNKNCVWAGNIFIPFKNVSATSTFSQRRFFFHYRESCFHYRDSVFFTGIQFLLLGFPCFTPFLPCTGLRCVLQIATYQPGLLPLKLIDKNTLGKYSKQILKCIYLHYLTAPQGCQGCQKNRKDTRITTKIHFAASIQPKLNELYKSIQNQQKLLKYAGLLVIFQIFFKSKNFQQNGSSLWF